jgi:hypothetical protein
MTLDNLGILNTNGPLTTIDIQRKRLKQLHNIITGNDPCKKGNFTRKMIRSTVIPQLMSDPANEDFIAVFQTRLTNVDSANECFSGCALT